MLVNTSSTPTPHFAGGAGGILSHLTNVNSATESDATETNANRKQLQLTNSNAIALGRDIHAQTARVPGLARQLKLQEDDKIQRSDLLASKNASWGSEHQQRTSSNLTIVATRIQDRDATAATYTTVSLPHVCLVPPPLMLGMLAPNTFAHSPPPPRSLGRSPPYSQLHVHAVTIATTVASTAAASRTAKSRLASLTASHHHLNTSVATATTKIAEATKSEETKSKQGATDIAAASATAASASQRETTLRARAAEVGTQIEDAKAEAYDAEKATGDTKVSFEHRYDAVLYLRAVRSLWYAVVCSAVPLIHPLSTPLAPPPPPPGCARSPKLTC